MKRPAIYSSGRTPVAAPVDAAGLGVGSSAQEAPHPPVDSPTGSGWRTRLARFAVHPVAMWAGMALLGTLLLLNLWRGPAGSGSITQKTIDDAVLHTLNEKVLPSQVARAYEAVLPSVVRVTGYVTHPKTGEQIEHGVGTGVVIVDRGVILTNLHVAAGAQTLKVEFHDGTETAASLIGAQPEHDLAVLQAHEVPDDLQPATMISTADLLPGDQVAAVGFPFGIGPSVSAGVVSGLQRSFESPDGKQSMDNLIQFDAAANPGNSGGPLVTMSGEVVGIVTAIYNPNRQRTFVGIGFAVPIESAASAVGLPPF